MENHVYYWPMYKKPWIHHQEETTSFYRINATLSIGQIGREKEKIIIIWKHHHCEV
jgi:hypothetical protein